MSKSYTYDGAGRLTGATLGSNTFAYEFGTQDSSCSSTPGYNANAAKNGNRTKLTINSVDTTYCYDSADRLISSSNATVTDAVYDDHGNTTSLGDSTHETGFAYDANDRNVSITSGNDETLYVRDAEDRIVSRETKTSGTSTSYVSYGYADDSDAPIVLKDGTGTITQQYLDLPGGVLVTIKPQSTSAGALTTSLTNIHGDTMATINADGALVARFMTGPFGEVLPITPSGITTSSPTNAATDTSYSYVGQHQKITEQDATAISGGIVQMGARVYIPILGRFISVDPVEGGTDNSYVYTNEPVNEYDLNGEFIFAAPIAWFVARHVITHVALHYAKKYAAQQAARTLGRVALNAAKQTRSVRSYKSPKVTQQVGNYKRTTWTVNAKNHGGASRAVYTKIKNAQGKTVRVYKDTYNTNNKFLHRKYKK